MISRYLAVLVGVICAGQVFCQTYKVQKMIPIGGAGGWDYLTADSQDRRLYVSHGAEVVVLDLDSQKIVGRVTGMTRIHGIAIDRAGQKGFISDGGANQVVVFDLKTLAIRKRVPAGQNPDAILYDAASDKAFAFNGKSEDISVIDAQSETVTATLKAGGKPEFGVSDGQGNIYFNLEDKNEIGHIDAKTLSVEGHWPISPCDSPSGLAIDASAHRLFSVCDNEKMMVVDASSGKVVASPTIGKGPDAAAFDPEKKLAFSSNGEDGTLTVVSEKNPNQYSVVQTVTTERGARTMALDEKTHMLYLSTASFGPAPAPTASQPHPRPSLAAGSFRLVVVAPK